MAKNSALKKQQTQEEGFDFTDMMTYSSEEDAMVGMMSGLVEASRHQMQMAMELTRIVVEKNSDASMKEEDILSTFQRASQAVAFSSPIKELWEKMNA